MIKLQYTCPPMGKPLGLAALGFFPLSGMYPGIYHHMMVLIVKYTLALYLQFNLPIKTTLTTMYIMSNWSHALFIQVTDVTGSIQYCVTQC